MSLAIQEDRKRYIKSERLLALGEVAARAGRETARCTTYPVFLYIKSERLLVPGEVAALAGRETARCTTYQVSLGVGLQAFTPVPQLCPVLVQLLNKPRRRALQTQPPPTHAPVARFYLTLGRWSSVAGVG